MKGIYTITKRKAEFVDGEWVAGDIIEVLPPMENRITPWLAEQLRTNDSNGKQASQMVVGVDETVYNGALVKEGQSAVTLNVKGSLLINAAYTAATGLDDAFWEIISTVNPPGSGTRYIRTVYLSSNYAGASDDVYSIVNLTTPCPQTDVEILQINYKIILDQTALQAEGSRSAYANEQFFSGSFFNGAPAFGNVKGYITHYDNQRWGTGMKFGSPARYASVGTNEMFIDTLTIGGTNSPSMSLTKQGLIFMGLTGQLGTSNLSTSSTEWCGFPIKGYGLGNAQGIAAVATINRGTPSSIQNTFGKSADTGATRRPFLDTTVISTSAASINLLDKGDWVDHVSDSYTMPYLYRITMETGGLAGVSTYKLWKRRFCRWIDNDARWYPGGIALGQMNSYVTGLLQENMDKTTKSNVMHGQLTWYSSVSGNTTGKNVLNSPDSGWTGYITQRYVYPEFITFDYTGITICDINQQYVNIDTDSTVALNVTGILQVDCDGADIYVAGEDTGLYKIEREIGDFNDANLTVRLLSPPGITDATSCRGVAAKGGGRHGHPGKIIAVRIMRSGSNYAVGDTVTFAGSLGASATARVATVDADGGITSVAVTNQGSGYIEDNIQAYVSSGSGLGASLDPVIGSGGNIWALFNDVTDGFMYLAHMTHIGSNDYTSGLAFAATGDTITRTDGTSFLADGFRIGMKIIVRTAEDAGNIGTFTITAVTATVITVSEALTDTTVGTDTQARIFGEQWEIMTETITDDSTNLDFLSAGPDTITGDGTSFVTQGFREGMKIVVSSANTGANNGIYTIASVSATVITLDVNDVLTTDASDATAVLSTLTDFTITNYTSGSPGRTGFIGLQIDPDHVDDRFAMITPAVKNANDGTAVQATTDGGLDWWSFANSTGTTTAGTTDRIRVGSTVNSASSAIEQFGPNTVGPFGTANEWTCNGIIDTSAGYMTWGSATAPVARSLGSLRCYNPVRNASGNIAVTCNGTAINRQFRTCSTIAQMASGSLSDNILLYDYGSNDSSDFSPGAIFNKGCSFGYLGKGIFWNAQWDVDPDPTGFYVWTCNGDGTRAVSEALPNGFWDEYGWDGTRWVLGNASAKTTHAEVTFSGTGITITAAAGTIVGAGFASTDWAGDGFLVGDTITIASSEDAANNGVYTIEQLSGTTLTVAPDALPAVNTTSAPDTTATVVGSHALIDGIAISFDDNAGADAFIINEYYDTHLYDGILKDNATNFNVDTYFAYAADDIGTTFSDSGSPTTTIPSANEGAVTNEPLTALYWMEGSIGNFEGFAERGACGWHGVVSVEGTAFAHKIPQSTDFVLRFKIAGAFSTTNEIHVGVCPWATITDLSDDIAIGELDENIQVVYNGLTFPELDQYTVNVRNTGNGTVQLAYAADRVQAVVGQTQVDFDGVTGGYGDFIDGAGYANSDVITMDDGSTVTVVTQTGGQVTTFTVSTPSLQSSGRTERIIASTGYSNLAFSGSVVTRTGGTNFDTEGFKVGMKLIIDASTGASNDGVWTITAVGTTTMTVAETFATEPTSVAGYFGTGLYQVGVSPAGGTGFALTLGTHNEVAVASLLGGTDEFSMHRIGTGAGNTSWRLNGVAFFTHAGALHTAADMGIVAHPDNTWGATLYDGSIDYTIDRRFLKVGNGTTTGANDLNFRCLPSLVAGTDMLQLYYDSGSGPTEFVYVTNGYTAPAAGEVSIIPMQGGLWFNTAQDGNTITGNWTITKGYNLQ